MEDWVGGWWDRLIRRAAYRGHPQAAVALADIERQAPVFFRAMGGDPALTVRSTVGAAHGARRRLLERVAGIGERVELGWRDAQSLYLPERIDLYPDAALNRELYFWLMALAARDDAHHGGDWFARNRAAIARRDARRISVGKTPGGPSTSQERINTILVEEALAGNRVVRLKGGDPFVFGRAVEEIEAVEAAGIAVTIVPGVTAALAAAAGSRLPITERGKRRALTILTGQTRDGPAEHDWPALAASGQTLAVYMGVRAGPAIARNLIRAGLDPATPVTIVENASLATQKTVTGRLDQVSDLLLRAGISGPAVLFIGVAPIPAASCDTTSIPLEKAA